MFVCVVVDYCERIEEGMHAFSESISHALPPQTRGSRNCNLLLTTLITLQLKMSYDREWDKGKDWNGEGHRGYSRGRDDGEYYGEGKRRKYNNGVRT